MLFRIEVLFIALFPGLLLRGSFVASTDMESIPNNTITHNTTSVQATKLHLNKKQEERHKQNFNMQKLTYIEQHMRTRPTSLPHNVKEHKPPK
jgi:hypothetical protein